jgi:hypothetical protein
VLEGTGDAGMHGLTVSLLNPRGKVALLTDGSGSNHMSEGRKVISIIRGDTVPPQFIPKQMRWYQAGSFLSTGC